MESYDLTDAELRAEYKRGQQLQQLAVNAGEADAEALFASVSRAIENEARVRNETRPQDELLVL